MRLLSIRDRQILRLAVPSIVSNITVPLLGLVDVAITGHIGNATHIGCVSVGSMIFSLTYWLFGFLRMGTSGLTAQALGKRDLPACTRQLVQSLAIALAIALLLLLLQWPWLRLALLLISPEADIAALTGRYFYICVWGAPAMLGLYSLNGWYIGMQNTRTPMLVAISQNVVNIVASLALVFACGMGIEGVALGTLIAQWTGLLLSAAMLLRYKRLRRYVRGKSLFVGKEIRKFFGVNRDIFLRTVCMVGVNLFFTSAGARQGAVVLAANAILLQLFLTFSYFMDGFAYAGEALAGRYFGAKSPKLLRDTIRHLFGWGTAMALLFSLTFWLLGTDILGLLTTDGEVVQTAARYLPWTIAIPFASMAAFLWDGVFVGITASRGMLISSAIATLAFFLAYLLLRPALANHALWLAMTLYLFLRGAVQTWLYGRGKRLQ